MLFGSDLLATPTQSKAKDATYDETKTITPNSSNTSLESLEDAHAHTIYPQEGPAASAPPMRRAWTIHIPIHRANNKHVPSLLKRSDSEQSFTSFADN